MTPDCFDHLRAAYADGLAGLPFTPPRHTPFRAKMAAQEDAFRAWCEGRDAREAQVQRRIAMNLDALDQATIDRAVAMQPGAFRNSNREVA